MANLFDHEHQNFFKLLNKYQVDYLLIGGLAVNLYGYIRGTGDVDIFFGSSPLNRQKLISAVEDFGYDTEQLKKHSTDEITMFSLGSSKEPGHIELTNRINGIEFEDAYSRINTIRLDGIPVKVIHFNDLIINKLSSARPRDLDDVENLSRIKREEEKFKSKKNK